MRAPNANVPAIDPATGKWTKEWYPFIADLVETLNILREDYQDLEERVEALEP